MKNTWMVLTGALAAGAASMAQAIPISGEVGMAGTVTLNNVDLGAASAATAFGTVLVGGADAGAFAGTAGDKATWHSFSCRPGKRTLWDVTVTRQADGIPPRWWL
jgi:hypothetical protein